MIFEFLPAFQGDCYFIHAGTKKQPFLILVDGGPAGTYEQHLRKRLMQLRDERSLDELTPLTIDLVIVSHVDDDHINGIIDLFEEIATPGGTSPLFQVRELWHNSFDEIIGNKDDAVISGPQFGTASLASFVKEAGSAEERDAALLLQSAKQGATLRQFALALGVELNDGKGGLLRTTAGKAMVLKRGGIRFTLLGPREAELAALHKEHDDWLKQQAKAGKPVTPGSLLQALTDTSVANLSSIVLLAEQGGKRALLTGDARSDFILKGMEQSGLFKASKVLSVDLLKVPHHGSDRNIDEEFFSRVPARNYLFSGNGEYGNPERKTLEMLLSTKPAGPRTLYITYALDVIDAQRKVEHEKARLKAEKKRQGKDKSAGLKPGAGWNQRTDSLKALELPAGIEYEVIDGKKLAF